MAQRRTDLAQEAHELWKESTGKTTQLSGVRAEDGTAEGFDTHRVTVLNEEGAAALGKPVGQYVTLELSGLLRREEDAFGRAIRALAEQLTPMIPENGLALVAGLGNRAITPDLIGPLATEHTLVTRHLVEHVKEHFGHLRPVAALSPGVLATTGVESGQLIQAAAEHLQPACVIAIDALASRSVERLCRTVQIADTGITPGSGVGNHRMALDKATLGIPVIAVGVPTVVEASTLMMDLLGKEDNEGLPGGDLFVTPREIDSRVADLSRVIGYGVSMALNPSLSVDDLTMLLE
jgi:spore protease